MRDVALPAGALVEDVAALARCVGRRVQVQAHGDAFGVGVGDLVQPEVVGHVCYLVGGVRGRFDYGGGRGLGVRRAARGGWEGVLGFGERAGEHFHEAVRVGVVVQRGSFAWGPD